MSSTVVVCVRDPDASNDYRVFNNDDVTIVDIDAGYSDLSDPSEFNEWAESLEERAQSVQGRSQDAADWIRGIVESYRLKFQDRCDHLKVWYVRREGWYECQDCGRQNVDMPEGDGAIIEEIEEVLH